MRSFARAKAKKGSRAIRKQGHQQNGIRYQEGWGTHRRLRSNPVPTVRATVEAEGANLSKRDIRLYLDGPSRGVFSTAGLLATSATTQACSPLAAIPSRSWPRAARGAARPRRAGPSPSLEGGQEKRMAPPPWKLEALLRAGGRFWPLPRRVRLTEHFPTPSGPKLHAAGRHARFAV